MAQKDYSMIFKLSAQLGREFTGAFSAAQQQLKITQSEIKALNKTQSDIAAYNRQQKAIENTARKLSDLSKQHDNIQKEINETAGYSSELQNKLVDKQRAIDKTTASLERETSKLKEMETSLRNAGIDTNNLDKESNRLSLQIEKCSNQLQSNVKALDQLEAEQKEATSGAKEFGDVSVSAFQSVGDAIETGVIAEGLKAIYNGYKECITIAADFQETMSTVEALSGASAEEMAALKAEAKELGATTKYTATESAEAMTYMGMAGWKTEQMLSGMNGVINLAAASGEDLATTSDIVTDNLTAFGLKASDTSRFADVLAAAATNSNTSVAIMGETFKQSASVAGALGYTIEDVATMTGLMANAGVKGSRAGTALRNTFNGLLSGFTLTAKAFGEYEYSAIKADGTMKDLGETTKELRYYFDQMTTSEKVANAQMIAGERGYNGLLSIVNATDEDFNKLTNSINNSTGAAERMASIKMDNLNGQLTLMNSAADALKTTIGEAFEPELRALAEVGTEILTGIQQFAKEHPVLLKSIIAITAEIGAFLLIYKTYQTIKGVMNTLTAIGNTLKAAETAATVAQTAAVTAETAATTSATAAQWGLNAAMNANPIGIVITGVAALTVGVIALTEGMKGYVDETAGMTASTKKQYNELKELNAEYQEACELYGETDERTLRLKYKVDDLTSSFENNKKTIEELSTEISELADNMVSIRSTYSDSMDTALNDEAGTLALIQKLEDLSALESGAILETPIMSIVDELNDKYSDLAMTYEDVTKNVDAYADAMKQAAREEYEQNKVQAQFDAYNEALGTKEEARNRIGELENNIVAMFENYDIENVEGLEDFYKRFKALAEDNDREITSSQLKELQKVFDSPAYVLGKSFDEELASYIEQLKNSESVISDANNLINETENGWKEVEESAQAAHEAMLSTAEGAVMEAYESVKGQIDALCASYDELYQSALDSFAGQYSIWDQAAEYSVKDIGDMTTALETQKAYWNAYNTDLNSLLDRASDIDGLSEMVGTFADGSEDSVNAISGMANATDEELKEMVSTWKDVKKQQSETADTLAKFVTDFQENLDDIAQQMKDTVEELNLSEEAEQSAIDTIDAYIEQLRNGKGAAVEVAEDIGKAVASALNGSNLIISPSESTAVSSGGTLLTVNPPMMDIPTEIPKYPKNIGVGGSNSEKSINILATKLGGRDYNAYASGTDGAEKGLALVGEEGPELVVLKGGETIFNADETKQVLATMPAPSEINAYASGTDEATIISLLPLLQNYAEIMQALSAQPDPLPTPLKSESNENSGKIEIHISPQFTINGGSGVDELENRVHDISDQLVDMVMERLAELDSDSKRGVYQ